MTVRIGFAEVFKMVNLHMIHVLHKFTIFQKRVTVRIGFAEVFKMANLPMIHVLHQFTIFKNE